MKNKIDIKYTDREYWEKLGLLYDISEEDKDFLTENYVKLTDCLLSKIPETEDGTFETVCFPVVRKLVKAHKITKSTDMKSIVESVDRICRECDIFDDDEFNARLDEFVNNYTE